MLTLKEINDSKPILLIYPQGSGGEHIAHTLSLNSNSCHSLPLRYSEHNNRYEVQCALDYYVNWDNLSNSSTWFNKPFTNFIRIC